MDSYFQPGYFPFYVKKPLWSSAQVVQDTEVQLHPSVHHGPSRNSTEARLNALHKTPDFSRGSSYAGSSGRRDVRDIFDNEPPRRSKKHSSRHSHSSANSFGFYSETYNPRRTSRSRADQDLRTYFDVPVAPGSHKSLPVGTPSQSLPSSEQCYENKAYEFDRGSLSSLSEEKHSSGSSAIADVGYQSIDISEHSVPPFRTNVQSNSGASPSRGIHRERVDERYLFIPSDDTNDNPISPQRLPQRSHPLQFQGALRPEKYVERAPAWHPGRLSVHSNGSLEDIQLNILPGRTGYDSEPKTTPQRSCLSLKGYKILAAVLTILVVGLAAGIVSIVLLANKGPEPNPTKPITVVDIVTFNGSMRIKNMEYDVQYEDKSSKKFKNFSEVFCTRVSSVYNNSDLSDSYQECQVIEYSRGSVVVHFALKFVNDSKETTTLFDKKDVKVTLDTRIEDVMEKMDLDVDMDSLKVKMVATVRVPRKELEKTTPPIPVFPTVKTTQPMTIPLETTTTRPTTLLTILTTTADFPTTASPTTTKVTTQMTTTESPTTTTVSTTVDTTTTAPQPTSTIQVCDIPSNRNRNYPNQLNCTKYDSCFRHFRKRDKWIMVTVPCTPGYMFSEGPVPCIPCDRNVCDDCPFVPSHMTPTEVASTTAITTQTATSLPTTETVVSTVPTKPVTSAATTTRVTTEVSTEGGRKTTDSTTTTAAFCAIESNRHEFFPHPSDCRQYMSCFPATDTEGSYTLLNVTCPAGSMYDVSQGTAPPCLPCDESVCGLCSSSPSSSQTSTLVPTANYNISTSLRTETVKTTGDTSTVSGQGITSTQSATSTEQSLSGDMLSTSVTVAAYPPTSVQNSLINDSVTVATSDTTGVFNHTTAPSETTTPRQIPPDFVSRDGGQQTGSREAQPVVNQTDSLGRTELAGNIVTTTASTPIQCVPGKYHAHPTKCTLFIYCMRDTADLTFDCNSSNSSKILMWDQTASKGTGQGRCVPCNATICNECTETPD